MSDEQFLQLNSRKSQEVSLSEPSNNAQKTDAEKKTNSTFGNGFKNTAGMGLQIQNGDGIRDYTPVEVQDTLVLPKENDNKKVTTDIPNKVQEDVLDYMGRMLDGANEVLQAREDESGVISWGVNFWLEIKKSENAKSNVKGNLEDTKSDIKALRMAHDGKLDEWTFAETFEKCRGVKYNQANINDCKQKAKDYEFVKTVVTMVQDTKKELANLTKGDMSSQMSPESASAAIIKALNMCGANSTEDINNFLSAFEDKHQDNEYFRLYGGNLHIEIKKGKPVIYREARSGGYVPATNDQLRVIAMELCKSLDRECAKALGANPSKNATAQELAQINENKLNQYKQAYETSFAKAFGKKDIKILSENFAQSQAEYVAYVEMGIDMLSMATMIIPGVNEMAAGWLLKGAQQLNRGVKTAEKLLHTSQKIVQSTQKLAPFLMANVILHPAELAEKLFSKKGMTQQDWQEWGLEVLQNGAYMLLGMGASKIAEEAATMFKTRALVNTLKAAGKSPEELKALMTANPTKFPPDMLKSMRSIDKIANALQISTESALDLSTTYLANMAFNNGDVTEMDYIMSIGTALMGAKIQKQPQFARMSDDAKVQYMKDAFSDLGMTDDVARDLLRIMDDISSGKLDPYTGNYIKPEVTVTAPKKNAAPQAQSTPKNNTDKRSKNSHYESGNKSHAKTKSEILDDLPKRYQDYKQELQSLIESNIEYKDMILDYIKVQRRADGDVSNPVESVKKYINTLEKFPEHHDFISELIKDGNIDANFIDGVNSIETLLELHIEQGFSKEDILKLASQNQTVADIRINLNLIKKYPYLRDVILRDAPEYKLIDSEPAKTSKEILNKRANIRSSLENYLPQAMNKLQQTLGKDFYDNVQWEQIIVPGTTDNDIINILNSINESSKFFARTSYNEQQYGKNIKWASKMNNISEGAELLITNGEDFNRVLNYIAHQYRSYDKSTTLASNTSVRNSRYNASGKYRGDNAEESGMTRFSKDEQYEEYFDKLKARDLKKREIPYDDIKLTNIVGDYMFHPAGKYVEPGLNHVQENYDALKPLFEKVKQGGKLNQQDIKYANDKISEIYFLMANIMPYERGSNGISDILIRSIYKGLNIDQPALKRGVSLDLEAFCMDLDEYKAKWNSFFE